MACGFRRRRPARGARRRGPGRAVDPLRRGGRAAGHRGPDPPGRRRGPARRPLPGPQRRRAHRPRPDRAAAPARGDAARWPRSASTRSRTRAPTASCAATTDGERRSASSRSPTRRRSTPTRSTPAPTCSSASVLELIPPGRAVSIEREVFPRLVGQGLYGRRLEGYWMDIGTPERYLQASWDILEGAGRDRARRRDRRRRSSRTAPRSTRRARRSSRRRGRAARARAVAAGRAERATRCCSTTAGSAPGAEVRGSILAAGVEVGEGARRSAAGAVIGEGATDRGRRRDRARVPGRSPDEVVEAEVTA